MTKKVKSNSAMTVIYGEEVFSVKEKTKAIIGSLLKKADVEFGLEKIEAENFSYDDFYNRVNTPPVFSTVKVVYCEDCGPFDETTHIEKWQKCLGDLAKNVYVVFSISKNIDGRKKFNKWILKQSQIHHFPKIKEWEQDKFIEFIRASFERDGYKTPFEFNQRLLDIAGPDQQMLQSEIEKIKTYVGDSQTIEMTVLEEVTSKGELRSFALTEAYRQGRFNQCLKCLNEAHYFGRPLILLLGQLVSINRLLLQIVSLREGGEGMDAIAKIVGKNPFYLKRIFAEIPTFFNSQFLAEAHEVMALADRAIKSGELPALLALQRIFSKIGVFHPAIKQKISS